MQRPALPRHDADRYLDDLVVLARRAVVRGRMHGGLGDAAFIRMERRKTVRASGANADRTEEEHDRRKDRDAAFLSSGGGRSRDLRSAGWAED